MTKGEIAHNKEDTKGQEDIAGKEKTPALIEARAERGKTSTKIGEMVAMKGQKETPGPQEKGRGQVKEENKGATNPPTEAEKTQEKTKDTEKTQTQEQASPREETMNLRGTQEEVNIGKETPLNQTEPQGNMMKEVGRPQDQATMTGEAHKGNQEEMDTGREMIPDQTEKETIQELTETSEARVGKGDPG